MKIKKIKEILLEEPVSVYDITVPETHNFLLKSNIFVHNCCQVIYKIFSNPIQTSITDLANAMQKTVPNMTQGTLTTQARPVSYTSPRRMMSDREAIQKAMQLFSNRR